jgi:hypothetical protein
MLRALTALALAPRATDQLDQIGNHHHRQSRWITSDLPGKSCGMRSQRGYI